MAAPLLPAAMVGEVGQARDALSTGQRAPLNKRGALIAPPSPLLLFDCCVMIREILLLPLAMVGDHSKGWGRRHRQECVSSILHHDGETA